MRLNEAFLQEITSRNDIEPIVSQYVALKRRGSTLVGLCPFHNEKTGSFTVYTNTNSYYCFGCGAGGDVINFMMRIENLDYIEAVRMLADRCGLQMPQDGYDDSMQKIRLRIYEVNRAAARYYHDNLVSGSDKRGLEYLSDRGLSASTIRHFGLGYAPDSWDGLCRYLRSNGFDDDVIIQANLASKSKNGGIIDRFHKRVMYPIIDLRGNVIAFGGRILPGDNSTAKYINTSDTLVYKKTNNVFALNFAKNSKRSGLILCEGYMDVIAMHQAGFDNAVAACGTSFTDEQAKLLSRYADEITVTMDADAAGEKSTNRTIGILNKTGMAIRVLRLPDAKDPDEYIKKFGAERFAALLDGAGNDIEYKLHSAEAKYDTDTDNGRLEYLREAASILSDVEDSIARELYTGRVAEKHKIPVNVLRQSIETISKNKYRAFEKKRASRIVSGVPQIASANPEKKLHRRACAAEESILSVLFMYPALLVQCGVKSDDFVSKFNRRVFDRLSEVISAGMQPDIGQFSGDFAPEEMGELVVMFNRRSLGDTAEKELADSVGVLRDEKAKISAADPSSMTDDVWADNIKRLGNLKNGVQ